MFMDNTFMDNTFMDNTFMDNTFMDHSAPNLSTFCVRLDLR